MLLGNEAIQEITVTLCNAPKLAQAMVPVKWNGENWVVTTQEDGKWYEYKEQLTNTKEQGTSRWANVMLRDGLQVEEIPDASTATIEEMKGKVVTQPGSMFVWIPRYMYQIVDGYRGEGLNYINDVTQEAGKIQVKFLKGTTDMPTDETILTVKNQTGKENWNVHPAFQDGSSKNFENGQWDKEIEGFWVAKYEAGYAEGNNQTPLKTSNVPYTQATVYTRQEVSARNYYEPLGYTVDLIDSSLSEKIKYPVFLPNTYSMNLISPADAFAISQALTQEDNPYGLSKTQVDTHLIKNSEWGAVAYLTQSAFGRNATQIAINEIDKDNIPETIYAMTGNDFVLQSTTANKYGVFDLSGGLLEYTAAYIPSGNYEEKVGSMLQKKEEQPVSTKYVTVYQGITSQSDTNYQEERNLLQYGDAIFETSIKGEEKTAWYSNITQFPSGELIFFLRGGNWNSGMQAGLFAFQTDNRAHAALGYRVSLIVE